MEEKRQLLKLTLQNLTLEGRKVRYNVLKPFDTILNYADNKLWLRIPSINLTDALSSIIKAFQNPIWAEQARERLKQIKLLTRVATV